jgi:spoIIIJ-associated protein
MMAERDLDSYLEGIGIDVDGDAQKRRDQAASPEAIDQEGPDGGAAAGDDAWAGGADDEAEFYDELSAEDGVTMDAGDPWGTADVDFESALAGIGLGGVVPDDLSVDQRAETFLVQLLLYLDPTYVVDVSLDYDGNVMVDIGGGDAGRLIGKAGRTLAALEAVMHAVVNRNEAEPPVRVNIDVGGYKRRRDERLRQLARRTAERVQRSGMPVELEPMSAAERRVVHMELAEDSSVESESAGEGRDRRVVVYPAGGH